MANESQYYNPIIQSMVAAHQGQLDRDKLKAQMEQHQAEQKLKQTQLGLEQTRIEHEHEHQLNLAELARQAHELTATAQKFANLKSANDLSRGGVDVGSALQSVGLPAMQGIPDYQTQQQNEINRIQAQSSAQTTGQMQAAEPYKKLEDERKNAAALTLHQQDMDNRLKEAEMHTTSAEKIAQMNADKMESVAKINGGYHLQGIRELHLLGQGDQAGMAQQLVDGIYNGNRDPKSLTPDEKRLVETYASATGELSSLPSDNKKYSKNLDILDKLQTLLNQYRNLGQNYSVDSKDSLSKGNAFVRSGLPIIGTRGIVTPGSDLANEMQSLKASAGQLATVFDENNRKSDREIERSFAGAFDPAATAKQNAQKLAEKREQLQGLMKTIFIGMKPDRVNKIMSDRGIIDFGAPKAASPVEEYVRDASGKLQLKK